MKAWQTKRESEREMEPNRFKQCAFSMIKSGGFNQPLKRDLSTLHHLF
jgi:hypothetical protein